MPIAEIGVFCVNFLLIVRRSIEPWEVNIPWDKGQIGVSKLVAYKVLLAFESAVEDTDDSQGLVLIALDGGFNLFWVEVSKPCCL